MPNRKWRVWLRRSMATDAQAIVELSAATMAEAKSLALVVDRESLTWNRLDDEQVEVVVTNVELIDMPRATAEKAGDGLVGLIPSVEYQRLREIATAAEAFFAKAASLQGLDIRLHEELRPEWRALVDAAKRPGAEPFKVIPTQHVGPAREGDRVHVEGFGNRAARIVNVDGERRTYRVRFIDDGATLIRTIDQIRAVPLGE